jgi:hypothetical protein
MLSLIEVTCPHCGAHGQIMLPPVGTIIVGPCPECQELVVVFCGHVLALQKETMLRGSNEEKREHMLSVLTEFLRDKVSSMVEEESSKKTEEGSSAKTEEEPVGPTPELGGIEVEMEEALDGRQPISKQEFETFTNVELRLLDNKDYFKSVFG